AAGIGRGAVKAEFDADGGVGRAGAAAASSSAMICRMDDRISSMDGSFDAGLFITASLGCRRPRRPLARLIRHHLLYAEPLPIGNRGSRAAGGSSPRLCEGC